MEVYIVFGDHSLHNTTPCQNKNATSDDDE